MIELYNEVSYGNSKMVTEHYSTSFSLGVRLLAPKLQKHIHAIYGFVRVADEIVDTFLHEENTALLEEFEKDTYQSIERGISTNPILQSFQDTVNKYKIDHSLIDAFLHSMKMDLDPQYYTRELYDEYIVGSAEVVGLMCLKVFLEGDEEKYKELKPYAEALGSVFQKVNFLRDLRFDTQELNRSYFPNLDPNNVTQKDLNLIYEEIESEFDKALMGIKKLPMSCKFGVYLTYKYYKKLFLKIKSKSNKEILEQRIRIGNPHKVYILCKSFIRHKAHWY